MKFAKMNLTTIIKLMEVEIDEFFISEEAMNKVKEILKLDGKDTEELTAIRNSVVKMIDNWYITPAIDDNLYGEYRKYQTSLSGITATIDHELFKMGALY